MKLAFWAGFLAIFSAAAQTPPDQRLYPSFYLVQDFLQLTDAQARNILGNNEQYNRWARDKQARIAAVQTEITWETDSETLDPHALGLRYMEVELICREMLEQAKEFRTRNLALLTADQRSKLKALEDAVSVIPLLFQANSGNLISGITNLPQASLTNANSSEFAERLNAIQNSFQLPVSGCTPGFTAVRRAGNFSNPAIGRPASPNPR
jgi:hypothetical protein